MGSKNDEYAEATRERVDSDRTLGDTIDRSLPSTTMPGLAQTAVSAGEALRTAAAVIEKGADRYRTHEVLGAGGMGEVRLCHDEAIGRDVAFKTLLAAREGSAEAEQRFLREVRVQGQLEHPSIVPVYDLGAGPNGALYFTMRRVRGHTLAEILDALSRADATMAASYSRRKLLGAFSRVCLAVDYAHARGVLHRDLKPSNIMLGDFGEVYVLDWGIAKLVAERATVAPVHVPDATRRAPREQREVVGTVGYMAPEQLFGLGALQDPRTDVYSLGAILFEILTLRRLHQGESFEALTESTRATSAARPTEVSADVPPELDAICARAAARERAARYSSARELSDAVERYLDGDRDLLRRRELSEERTAAARTALDAVAAPSLSDAESAAARAAAVREVTAALAFAPENVAARALLVRLLVEPPARVPPEVRSEMAASSYRNLQQFVRYGLYGLVCWLMTLPAVAIVGVRAWTPILITAALCVVALASALWVRRQRDLSFTGLMAPAVVVFATSASASCYLGPFVLVPQLVAVITLWFALQCRSLRERRAIVAIGTLAVALPFLVELLGIFPPAYAFVDGNLTLFARAVTLSPHATIGLVFYSSVSSVALSAVLLSSIRQMLAVAEQKLFLHAWHLRQVLPEDTRPAAV